MRRAFFSSALVGPEGRLRLVEGDGVVEDAVSGPRDPRHRGGRHVAAVLTGEAGSPVCALKEAQRPEDHHQDSARDRTP